eukprot:jgi/Chlat1/2487/Chrsp175S02425
MAAAAAAAAWAVASGSRAVPRTYGGRSSSCCRRQGRRVPPLVAIKAQCWRPARGAGYSRVRRRANNLTITRASLDQADVAILAITALSSASSLALYAAGLPEPPDEKESAVNGPERSRQGTAFGVMTVISIIPYFNFLIERKAVQEPLEKPLIPGFRKTTRRIATTRTQERKARDQVEDEPQEEYDDNVELTKRELQKFDELLKDRERRKEL